MVVVVTRTELSSETGSLHALSYLIPPQVFEGKGYKLYMGGS